MTRFHTCQPGVISQKVDVLNKSKNHGLLVASTPHGQCLQRATSKTMVNIEAPLRLLKTYKDKTSQNEEFKWNQVQETYINIFVKTTM